MGSKHCLLLNTFTFEQCVQWLHLSHWPQFTNSTVYTSGDIFLHTQHRSSSGISDNRSLSLSALSNSCGCCCSPEVVACGWVEEMLIDGLAFPLFALCFVGCFFVLSWLLFDVYFLQYSFLWWWHKVAGYWLVFSISFCLYCLSYFSTFEECVWWFIFFFSLFVYKWWSSFFCDILVGSNGVYARFSEWGNQIVWSVIRLARQLCNVIYLLSCIPGILRRSDWHSV